MTEDEAKTKWCPFVRMLSHIPDSDDKDNFPAGYNRNLGVPMRQELCCIASACMAWRWSINMSDAVTLLMRPDGELEGDPKTRSGYCGLAGKP